MNRPNSGAKSFLMSRVIACALVLAATLGFIANTWGASLDTTADSDTFTTTTTP